MKYILATILATISLNLFAAPINVPIVWPFAVGAQQANFIRAIVEQANKDQTKYNFMFENKPGAGGTVAARYVLDYKGLALLSSSSSFWVRPEFYPVESQYRTSDFRPVMIECLGQPYAIVSVKYKTLDELRQQKFLNIGLIQGSLTEALGRQLQTLLPNTELNFIGFQGTHQPTQEMLAGRLDLNVDLPAFSVQWIEDGKINVIGASGTAQHKNFKTFNSQGVKGFDGLVSNYAMYIKAGADPEVIKELHAILNTAATNSPVLKGLYDSDYCSPVSYDLKQTNAIFNKWSNYWPKKLETLKSVKK
jgi:tripartite-type tricarboxylate transporter receptor subunit TctC